jgi:predicted porin
LTRNLTVYLDYTRTDRDDANYVGYYDYTEDEYAVRATLQIGTLKFRAKYSWWDRDYPRAYAYENLMQPRMDYDGAKASVKGEAGMGRNFGLWAEYEYKNTETPDLRYDYSKYQVVAGVKWEI